MATTTAQERTSAHGQATASDGGDLAVVRREWQHHGYQAPALTRLALTMAPIAFGIDTLLLAVVVASPDRLASWIKQRRPQRVPRRPRRDPHRHQRRSHPALWRLLRRRLARRHKPQPPHLVQALIRSCVRVDRERLYESKTPLTERPSVQGSPDARDRAPRAQSSS